MRRFSLLLNVSSWVYSREHYYNLDSSRTSVRRRIAFVGNLVRGEGAFLVNGVPFRSDVNVGVLAGDPFQIEPPFEARDIGERVYQVPEVLGRINHLPETGGDYPAPECLTGDIRVSPDVFDEVFALRSEIDFLSLAVIGATDLVGYQNRNWTPGEGRDAAMFILGFSYSCRSSDLRERAK